MLCFKYPLRQAHTSKSPSLFHIFDCPPKEISHQQCIRMPVFPPLLHSNVSKLLVLCQYDWWETVYNSNYNLHFCYCQWGEIFSRIFEKHCLLMNNVLPFFYWVGGHWSFLYEFTEVCYILKTLVRYSFKHEKKTEKDKNLYQMCPPKCSLQYMLLRYSRFLSKIY